MSHSGVSSVSEAAPLAQTQTKATCKPSTHQDGPVLRQGENPAANQDEQRPPKGRSTSYPLETLHVMLSRKKAVANVSSESQEEITPLLGWPAIEQQAFCAVEREVRDSKGDGS